MAYYDNLYEYSNRPMCSEGNPNGCGSDMLFCDMSHGKARCVSKMKRGSQCNFYKKGENPCFAGECRNGVCIQTVGAIMKKESKNSPWFSNDEDPSGLFKSVEATSPRWSCLKSAIMRIHVRITMKTLLQIPFQAVINGLLKAIVPPIQSTCIDSARRPQRCAPRRSTAWWMVRANEKFILIKSFADCKDRHILCSKWKDNGECEDNKDFMDENCRQVNKNATFKLAMQSSIKFVYFR